MGQSTSNLGRFEAGFSRGCAPFTININEVDGLGNVSRAYTYEQGAAQTSDTFYTYTTPGIYEIVQLIGATIDQNGDTMQVEVLPPTPPQIDYSVCNANEIFISVIDSVYDRYEIETISGNINIDESTSYNATLNRAQLGNETLHIEGFYTDALPNCGVSEVEVAFEELINSAIVLDFDFEFVCQDEVNLIIDYEADTSIYHEIEFGPDGQYTSVFSGNLKDSVISLSSLSIGSTFEELCFRINAISRCDQSRINGVDFCSAYSPEGTLFENVYSSYDEDNNIVINLGSSDFGSFNVTKITDEIDVSEFNDVDSILLDQSINPLRQYTYDVEYITTCDQSDYETSINAPYIFLEEISTNRFEVHWVAAQNQLPEATYQLNVGSESAGFTAIENPDNPHLVNATYENGSDQQIFLSTVPSYDPLLQSNRINIPYEYIVYVPEAFTPNGDGLNDELEIFGLPAERFTLKIFNRWGELIFVSSDLNNRWDGKSKNGKVTDGTYAYTIDFFNEEGELFHQEGSFVLLKN